VTGRAERIMGRLTAALFWAMLATVFAVAASLPFAR